MPFKEVGRIFSTKTKNSLVVKEGEKLIGFVQIKKLQELLDGKLNSIDISVPEDTVPARPTPVNS